MLVAVTGFGSVWRHRLGEQVHEGGRFTAPVYFNTTGVAVNGHVRQRPQICGYARFDTAGGFDPNHLSRMMNRVFECADPSVWMECNKLLLRRMMIAGERPDFFLVIARSNLVGELAVGTDGWKSDDIWLLSFSECGPQQEAMLLVPVEGWIRGSLGRFALESYKSQPWIARLVLSGRE